MAKDGQVTGDLQVCVRKTPVSCTVFDTTNGQLTVDLDAKVEATTGECTRYLTCSARVDAPKINWRSFAVPETLVCPTFASRNVFFPFSHKPPGMLKEKASWTGQRKGKGKTKVPGDKFRSRKIYWRSKLLLLIQLCTAIDYRLFTLLHELHRS